MDDDELHARFAGLRIAIAFAIKAASRTPADLNHHVATLKEIENLFPASSHPAARQEIQGVVAALLRMPVRDPGSLQQASPRRNEAATELDVEVAPRDLLTAST